MNESMMTDLDSRIIGSRLLEAGLSPYFYHWKSSDNLNLLAPNISLPYNLNGVTTTPFFLWLQQPLAKLNYCNIKFIWWLIEEVLLFTTICLTCLVPQTLGKQLLTIVISSVFFCYSRNWWQHVYSGQYYILFAFVFALTIWLSGKKKGSAFFIFPIITLIRPFFALATLPWLLRIKFFTLHFKYLVAGVVISIILLVVSGTINQMPEFTKAMKYYNSEIIGWQQRETPVNPPLQSTKMEDCVIRTDTVKGFGGGCLFPVQHYLKLLNIRLGDPLLFSALLLLAIFLFIYVTGYKRITGATENLLLASFIIYMLCELFTPANRNPYNMVEYLGLPGLLINKGNKTTIALFIAGLAFNHDFPFRFVYQREIGEILVLLSIYVIFFKRNTTAINNKMMADTV
jgi:hypothetical protein